MKPKITYERMGCKTAQRQITQINDRELKDQMIQEILQAGTHLFIYKAVDELTTALRTLGLQVVEDGGEYFYYLPVERKVLEDGKEIAQDIEMVNLSTGDNYEIYCSEYIREMIRAHWRLSRVYGAAKLAEGSGTTKDKTYENPLSH